MKKPYRTFMPNVHESCFIADSAVLIGDVRIGKDSSVFDCSVLRGDIAEIVIGERSNVQDGCMLHVNTDMPLIVGNNVTVGHAAVLHGCIVGDNTLVGIGAIVLNEAKIGKNCIIGAGALIPPGKEIPDGSVVFGSPGKVVRTVTEEDIAKNRKNADAYVELGKEYKRGSGL